MTERFGAVALTLFFLPSFIACKHQAPAGVNMQALTSTRARGDMRQQFAGQVHLAVVAAAIQPPMRRAAEPDGKQPNDFAKALPLVGKALRIGTMATAAIGLLFDFFSPSSSNENDVPSPRIEVLFDQSPEPWIETPAVSRTYLPTWPRIVSTFPRTFGARTNLVIAAYDGSGKESPIGNCTISGVPIIDGNNYIVEDSMVCNGRLLAAKVQLQPVFRVSALAREAYNSMFRMGAAYRRWRKAPEHRTGCPKKLAPLIGMDKDLVDPWGHAYIYECPSSDPIIIKIMSRGPDGKVDTADDLHLSDDLSGIQEWGPTFEEN